MPQDISKGETFADGQLVTASRLNNLADLATILTGFISDKSPVTGEATDYLVIYRPTGGGSLKKALFQGGVSSVALTMPTEFTVSGSPVTTTGTLIVTKVNQSGNKHYASPADGSDGPPTFRALGTRDFTTPTVVIAAAAIDWNLGSSFYKEITANTVLSFANAADGMTIKVVLRQNAGGRTVTWPASMIWAGAVDPVLGTVAGSIDLYVLQQVFGTIIGVAHQHLG